MDNFEKVEKLKERADVSYEEAKDALEKSNWDILDAIIYLEQSGKVKQGASGYTTRSSQKDVDFDFDKKEEKKVGLGELCGRFFSWCGRWLEKGNNNSFCVERKGKEVFRMPITVLVLLFLFSAGMVIWLLIIGLFFSMRYRFAGPDVAAVDINRAFDSAADAAESIKSEFSDTVAKDK